jgi:putative transposase
MARLRRLSLAGIPAHIRIRGNDRQDIFRTEGDRIYFHRCLVEVSRRCGLAVHAYVFMPNHVHLVATGQTDDAPSKAIQCMGRRYVSYFNYLHGRTGTLWEGRFRSCPIETDRYLLACHRYVELNPVRAGLAGQPGESVWSSFRCNAWGVEDDLVTPHSLYMELGGTESRRRSAYLRLFEGVLGEEVLSAIRHAADRGWALGGDEFCERLGLTASRPTVPRKAGRPRRGARSRSDSPPDIRAIT